MNTNAKKFLNLGIFMAIAIAFDQWTKYLAYNFLRTDGPIPLIPGVFELHYTENRGAAFGMLKGQIWFFLLIAILVLGFICYFIAKLPATKRFLPLFLSLALLTSGAVGNMIDRVVRGFVVDFLYFSLIDFPIFNVADCYVCIATALLILLLMFYYKDDELSCLSFKKEK